LSRGGWLAGLKHAVKAAVRLLRHRLGRALFPSSVVEQLEDFTPGEVMNRWEF
jgi:hypothetical protein